jgi:hypothetical protein
MKSRDVINCRKSEAVIFLSGRCNQFPGCSSSPQVRAVIVVFTVPSWNEIRERFKKSPPIKTEARAHHSTAKFPFYILFF